MIDNGGRVTCTAHGGAYLDAAVKAHPRRKIHHTPITTWIKADDDEYPCEECAAGRR